MVAVELQGGGVFVPKGRGGMDSLSARPGYVHKQQGEIVGTNRAETGSGFPLCSIQICYVRENGVQFLVIKHIERLRIGDTNVG